VLRALASSFLSLLLVTTLVWGGCVSCEQYFMFGQSRGCCNPDGHCNRKAPHSNNSRDCKQIAFDHQKGIDLHFDLPAISIERITFCVRDPECFSPSREVLHVDASPPDLQVLNSTFLI